MKKFLINKNNGKLLCQIGVVDFECNNEFEEIVITDSEPNFYINKWNGKCFEEMATEEELIAIKKNEVPQELSRMKFIIQVFLTTRVKYEDIVLFIQKLNFDEAQKYVILTRLRSATHFDRNSKDLLTIASFMQISDEQLDEIFIEGNKLQ